MITPEDDLIPLGRIPRRIRSPRPPHLSTVARWALRGVGDPPVKLDTVVVGGRRYTTAAALEAFVAATTAHPAVVPVPAAGRRRDAEICRAGHELDAEGIA